MTAPEQDDDWINKDALKFFTLVSAILSVVAFLIPKNNKDEGRTDGNGQRNLNRLNDNLKDILSTALKIDEQKRLEYIKRKPTL